jgi:predicted type IV restriction endonuclease
MATAIATMNARTARDAVAGSRWAIVSETGSWVVIDSPRSP